jgi:hypothetical protein
LPSGEIVLEVAARDHVGDDARPPLFRAVSPERGLPFDDPSGETCSSR